MRILKIHSLPSVSSNWVDRDEIMLCACFQILSDFIEKEDGLNHCNYEAHKDFVDEARFLQDWFNKREDINHEEDTQMLSRLMKIRTGLWT